MTTRYVGLALLLMAPYSVSGQASADWRALFADAERARQAADVDAYATGSASAARAMPAGHLDRPFIQYHAARAAALAGRRVEAVAWLRTAWDEGIESLMISFAPHDSAFASLRDDPGFRGVMGLAAEMELTTTPLGGGVHLVRGAGSNVVAQIGSDGVLLVDTGYGPALPALRAALRSLGGGRVDRLIVTHPHEDHMGATPELGDEALVLAHPGTADAMDDRYPFIDGVELPPKPAAAMPDIVVARDTTFRFNGEDVRVFPTVAHTAGDVSVHFVGARVVHLGDTWLAGNPMMYPGGEDPEAFLDGLEAFLDSMHPETVVVGGHDGPADVAAVRAQIAEARACMALVEDALAEGLSLEATVERANGRFAPQWIRFFHRAITSGR